MQNFRNYYVFPNHTKNLSGDSKIRIKRYGFDAKV